MADENVIFKKGKSKNLPEAIEPGSLLATTDEGELYLDYIDDNNINQRIQLGATTLIEKTAINKESLVIRDVSKIEHKMEVIVAGKNLIHTKDSFEGAITNGTIVTRNEDGSITFSGAPTPLDPNVPSSANFSFVIAENIKVPKSDNYFFSIGSLSYKNDQIYFILQDQNNSRALGVRVDSNTTITLDKTKTYKLSVVITYLAFPEPTSVVALQPQLELGTTATEYVSYINPSNITITKCGKNLLPYPFPLLAKNSTTTYQEITYTDNGDGSISITGTTPETSGSHLKLVNAFALLGNTNINATDDSANNEKFTLSKRLFYNAKEGQLVAINIGKNTSVYETIYPQIELGTEATEYEPYKGTETYGLTADGTIEGGITSLSPTVTLMASDPNVYIYCTYIANKNSKNDEALNQIVDKINNSVKAANANIATNTSNISTLQNDLTTTNTNIAAKPGQKESSTEAEKFNDYRVWEPQYNNNITPSDGSSLFLSTNTTGNAATAEYAHAEGTANLASGKRSHAEGKGNISSGQCTHTEGSYNIAKGMHSHAEGNYNLTNGYASHIEGSYNYISEDSSSAHAEGTATKALNVAAHSEGEQTCASGRASHAEGTNNVALGQASHAEGINNSVNANYSYVGGSNNNISYTGDNINKVNFIHGENNKIINGSYNFGFGTNNEISFSGCTLLGDQLKTYQNGQIIIGKYNKQEPDAIFVVGTGSSEERVNSFSVWNGGIKIGETILSEVQLKKLLALI